MGAFLSCEHNIKKNTLAIGGLSANYILDELTFNELTTRRRGPLIPSCEIVSLAKTVRLEPTDPDPRY